MPSSSRTHRAPAASAAGEVPLLHTIWRHFFSDGVVACVWECGDYARNTPEGLLRCARQELRGNGAATVLRWDLPVAIFKSVTMLPTEDELRDTGFDDVGKMTMWPGRGRGRASRPFSTAIGSLFWSVPSSNRGHAFAHDAWHVPDPRKRRQTPHCPPRWRPSDYVAARLRYSVPTEWQCHHTDWDAALTDQLAFALHTSAHDPGDAYGEGALLQTYNQVHLSWGEGMARALFYVNASRAWRDPAPSLSRNRSSAASARARALRAAALEAAARAHAALRAVVAGVPRYARLPVVQLRPDARNEPSQLRQRWAARSVERGGVVDVERAARLAARKHLGDTEDLGTFRPAEARPTAEAWPGDSDGLGPRTRCNVSIHEVNFRSMGSLLGPVGGACWPLPSRTQSDAPWICDKSDVYADGCDAEGNSTHVHIRDGKVHKRSAGVRDFATGKE